MERVLTGALSWRLVREVCPDCVRIAQRAMERARIVQKLRTALGLLETTNQPNTSMRPPHATPKTGGFTGWDLLVVIATVGLLIVVLLGLMPSGGGGKAKASRINCVSNIKQIGLAMRLWANDHAGKFPMAVSSEGTNGGTMEYSLNGEVWRHFQILSNELNNPKVLACTTDKRTKVTDWKQLTNNAHLSYFAGLDADETRPQTILSGDRNLKSSASSTNGVLFLRSGDTLEWTKALHNKVGNFGLGDGSAQQINTPAAAVKQLEAALQSTGQPAHRLALPE